MNRNKEMHQKSERTVEMESSRTLRSLPDDHPLSPNLNLDVFI